MLSTTAPNEMQINITKTERVFGQTPTNSEQVVPLSLLDAATAKYAVTNAIWLFEHHDTRDVSDVAKHLCQTLGITLDSYPQWVGQLSSIGSATIPTPAKDFPIHARRFGRVYTHFGGSADVGVEFISAASSATLDSLYPFERTKIPPIWSQKDNNLSKFIPASAVVHALEPNEPDSQTGLRKPIMAIQCTTLLNGGFVLAIKISHPLADISALIHFVKDWAGVSQAIVNDATIPVLNTIFEPSRLDALASGDINNDQPDSAIIERISRLPLHRYDWWAAPGKPPKSFLNTVDPLNPPGKPMPWEDWDVKASVSDYIIHLNKEQVDFLWKETTKGIENGKPRTTKHDAVLAHIWSCIIRARQLAKDDNLVHCDLVLGVRPVLNLGHDFIGSPIVIMNIELPGSDVGCTDGHTTGGLVTIAQKIRDTITKVNNASTIADHLHSVAYEQSPQRIWQAFLGHRHILVTSWARSGIYKLTLDLAHGYGTQMPFCQTWMAWFLSKKHFRLLEISPLNLGPLGLMMGWISLFTFVRGIWSDC